MHLFFSVLQESRRLKAPLADGGSCVCYAAEINQRYLNDASKTLTTQEGYALSAVQFLRPIQPQPCVDMLRRCCWDPVCKVVVSVSVLARALTSRESGCFFSLTKDISRGYGEKTENTGLSEMHPHWYWTCETGTFRLAVPQGTGPDFYKSCPTATADSATTPTF